MLQVNYYIILYYIRLCYIILYYIILHYITLYYTIGRGLLHVAIYIPQRGVQWKQGVVIYMTLYTSSLYNTNPIHCTPPPLHPPSAENPCKSTIML